MLKYLTLAAFVPLGLAALACGSEDAQQKPRSASGSGATGGTGGSIGIGGGAGTSMISVGGGANSGSGATSGSGGEIPPETADGLRSAGHAASPPTSLTGSPWSFALHV